MEPTDLTRIASERPRSQAIAGHAGLDPEQVAERLGAIQAQDYQAALWAIGRRTGGATRSQVEAAIASKAVVRTWLFRGTLQFVAAKDLRWMRALVGERVIMTSRPLIKRLGLTAKHLVRFEKVLTHELAQSERLGRDQIYALWEKAGLRTDGQRGLQALWRLSLEGILCQGPHMGKQPGFVLADSWLPAGPNLRRPEALERLALRYFEGHGPATVQDFAWWSGLTLADARQGLGAAQSSLGSREVAGIVYWGPRTMPKATKAAPHLLPGFDELFLGYKDRSMIIAAKDLPRIVGSSNGRFAPIVEYQGRIVAVWKLATAGDSSLMLEVAPFAPSSPWRGRALESEVARYSAFVAAPVALGPR